MNPSTPKTELPPSNQLWKTEFRGAHHFNSFSRRLFKTSRIALLLLTLLACQSCLASKGPDFGSMMISVAHANEKSIRIVTTGAEFEFDLITGQITLRQRIPEARTLGTITGLNLTGAKLIRKKGECRVTVREDKSDFIITPDSLLRIQLQKAASINVQGVYAPVKKFNSKNRFFLPDEMGGIGLYPFGTVTAVIPDWKAPWTVPFHFTGSGELWVSVFPPRRFNEAQSQEGMLHSFSWKNPFPFDEQLKEWRKFGSVLTLHSWIWKGSSGEKTGVEKDDSWLGHDFKPKSEKELKRVIQTAHSLGMKVIPYMSPFYQSDPTARGLEKFLKQIERVRKTYGFDGVYFDGLYSDISLSYDLVRGTRKVIGEQGILHIHTSTVPDISCPFIETYADYALHGEHAVLNEDFIRWKISGWNMSNAIGLNCYSVRTRPSKSVIEMMLKAHARMPIWVDDGTWDGENYNLSASELDLMEKEYLPSIEAAKSQERTPNEK